MLTEAQCSILYALNPQEPVQLVPYNPKVAETHRKLKDIIWGTGVLQGLPIFIKDIPIVGRQEIDAYVECPLDYQAGIVRALSRLFGSNLRPQIQMVQVGGVMIDGYELDLHITDPREPTYRQQRAFCEVLTQPNLLAAYERVKRNTANTSIFKYSGAKYGLMNEALVLYNMTHVDQVPF